jgi:YtfJ family uncharacterized protein
MTLYRLILTTALTLVCSSAFADAPAIGKSLPLLVIEDKGEILYQAEEDDFSFAPWSSATNPGQTHVIQYFGANVGDRDTFEPLTDLIQSSLQPGSVYVSTVLNLDAAMWGTSGFVISEIKKNKKIHKGSTMVLDEDGDGVDTWGLGKDGTGVVILDKNGIVLYFSKGSLSPEELEAAMSLIETNIKS